MSYSHITHEEREIISEMRAAGNTLAAIGDRLNRAAGTISRELRRNRTVSEKRSWYSPLQATRKARDRRKSAKESLPRKIFSRKLRRNVISKLRLEWSPEQIAGRMKTRSRNGLANRVSHTTIDKWIKDRKREGDDLHRHLRQSHRQRRVRYGHKTKRFVVAGRVSIDDRPAVVDKRTRIGDWEGDLIEGKNRTAYLLTLVDRHSGYLLMKKVGSKHRDVVRKAAIELLRKMKSQHRHTVTFDNGSEFSDFKQIANRTGVKVYFAHPYSSWERGTNENTNGLVRQYVPKGSDIRVLRKTTLAKIARRLNNRPRKRLGYQTPAEVLRK